MSTIPSGEIFPGKPPPPPPSLDHTNTVKWVGFFFKAGNFLKRRTQCIKMGCVFFNQSSILYLFISPIVDGDR